MFQLTLMSYFSEKPKLATKLKEHQRQELRQNWDLTMDCSTEGFPPVSI